MVSLTVFDALFNYFKLVLSVLVLTWSLSEWCQTHQIFITKCAKKYERERNNIIKKNPKSHIIVTIVTFATVSSRHSSIWFNFCLKYSFSLCMSRYLYIKSLMRSPLFHHLSGMFHQSVILNERKNNDDDNITVMGNVKGNYGVCWGEKWNVRMKLLPMDGK